MPAVAPTYAPDDGAPGTEGVAVDHVLLITIDTLRADALGFAGNQRAATPNLDRLAAAGVVFEQAHAHNVMTLPSHVNILTGLLPYQHGVRDNAGFVLPEGVPTLATRLAAAGFATAAFVGAFPLDARFGLDQGFEIYDDRYPEGTTSGFALSERRGDRVVAPALEWWRSHQDRRRFLWLHLYDPHAPYAPVEPWASRFTADPYLGEVAAADAYLAPLLAAVLDAGEAGTLVVFTADHGEALGDHGETSHGLFAYEATLRVPLVLWAPGLGPARRSDPARHIDLVPTILAAAGLAPDPALPGRSLLTPSPRDGTSYFEALRSTLDRDWAPLRGTIRDQTKFISLPLPELYDLSRDPQEERNLIDERRERAEQLAALLPAESEWPPRRGAVSADEARALRALGYLAGEEGAVGGRRVFTAADDPKTLVWIDQRVHRFIELHETGRLDEAIELMRALLAERPDLGLGYYHLAQALLDRRQVGEALAVMAEAQRRGVASRALLRQYALTLSEVGQNAQALEVLGPLALGSQAEPDALNAYGLVLAEAGRLDDSAQVLERVFVLDSRNPEARQNLALVALHRDDWRTCERESRRAIELNDALPLAWNYLGLALYNQGRGDGALEAWQRSLALAPADFDVLYNLAMVAAELRRHELARSALQRFIEQAPPEHYAKDVARARQQLEQLP